MANAEELPVGQLPATYVEGFHDPEVVKKMRYRRLGKTDMFVSVLSLGASSLGAVFRSTDDDESIQVVVEAVKAGINYIDVAPWYGHTKAETVLGRALRSIPREAYYLATKVCRYFPETLRMLDFSAERTRSSALESLERLGVTQLDVLQVHDPEYTMSLEAVVEGAITECQKLKDDGITRYIGITGYPMTVQKSLIEMAAAKGIRFDTSIVYCRQSMNDTTMVDTGFLNFLLEQGIGLVYAAPTSMGLLTARGPPDWHPALPEIRTACREATQYCTDKGVDIAWLGMHFCIDDPRLPTTLVSTASVERMRSNIRACHVPLTDAEKQLMEEVIKKYFDPLPQKHWEGVEPLAYRKELIAAMTAKGWVGPGTVPGAE